MSNPPQRSFSRYSSIFRQSQPRPAVPQPQVRPPPPAPQVRPPQQQEPTPPPPSQPAPRAPPSPPPPPPAARPPPPLSPKPIAPTEDSTGLMSSGQRPASAPPSPSTTLSQRQPITPPLSPVPTRPTATGSPLLTSGQRSPVVPSPPSTPPPQQKSDIQLVPSPSRPADPAAATTTLPTPSPVLTSGQHSPVPGTPTKSPVAAPPLLAPSSSPRRNGSPAETHSPVLTSVHRSPVSVHPTVSQVPSSPESLSEPPYSPLVRFQSPPLEEANHHRMKPVSPLKLPKQAHPEMSDLEQETYDHKKVVLLEGQPAGGRNRAQNPAAKNNNNNNKEVKKGKGVSFVTLAGENRGAVMDLITSPAGKKLMGKNDGRPRKLVEEESEEEGGGGNHGEVGVPAMRAVVNSNVQGVNNSILHDTTYSHHDPGIHLVYPGRSRRLLKSSPVSR